MCTVDCATFTLQAPSLVDFLGRANISVRIRLNLSAFVWRGFSLYKYNQPHFIIYKMPSWTMVCYSLPYSVRNLVSTVHHELRLVRFKQINLLHLSHFPQLQYQRQCWQDLETHVARIQNLVKLPAWTRWVFIPAGFSSWSTLHQNRPYFVYHPIFITTRPTSWVTAWTTLLVDSVRFLSSHNAAGLHQS
jgi:hypothetical protein